MVAVQRVPSPSRACRQAWAFCAVALPWVLGFFPRWHAWRVSLSSGRHALPPRFGGGAHVLSIFAVSESDGELAKGVPKMVKELQSDIVFGFLNVLGGGFKMSKGVPETSKNLGGGL